VGVGEIVGKATPWQDAEVPGPDGTGVHLASLYDPDWAHDVANPADPDYFELRRASSLAGNLRCE